VALAIQNLELSSMTTIVATGTVVFDAGSTADQLVIEATPQPSGAPINMGTVTAEGPFSLSAVVPSGTTYAVEAVASDIITNTVTQTATISV
jgi:hypothetical protein